jgi:hypothetical protein
MSDQPNDITKVSFNLYDSDIAMLRELASWGVGENITQALRISIATEHYLRAEVEMRHVRVLLMEEDGRMKEMVFRDNEVKAS